ncbi:nitrate- and nitrite sensing domain-containing protein [Streptomyces sp. NPDC052101]|uniref:sensor histidine kinase n=1 Tax=Streptomyces sp. NPDC052101 TaxID=3155763 RepID=UPI003424A7BF
MGTGRPTHVRTRLIVAVAVVAAAVAAAGAPSLLTASQDVSDSQDLVTLAAHTQDALALAHSLADERDDVTSYVAAGRPKSKAPSEDRSARVDRQVEDLRAEDDTPAGLRSELDGIDAVRRAALTGKTTALQTHQAYSEAITELHRVAEQLADQSPPRAGSGAHALAELDTAVQQSAAARGLLLAALNVPSATRTVINPVTGLATTTSTGSEADRKQRDELTAAAQQARLRADTALADFRATAPKTAVDSYDSTVTGGDVNSAEKYLATLTDQPTLADSELTTSTKKLDAALSARVDLMRGTESALYDHRTKDLAKLRDDDVTALEIRIAVLGALMLVAVGLATAMARTLTRPLSVLRRGSARLAESGHPATQEPIAFTGRNDEFAQVVRSVNALHAHAAALYEQTVAVGERVTTLETDRKHLVGQRQKMADAREALHAELNEAAARLERLRTSIGGTFVNLSLRTLGLVERQLAVIEDLEEREQDPDRLATLFKLDHFATVMRRHSENLLVLAGAEHVQQHHGAVPLVDVVRAGVSEIERYERVRIAALPPHAHVAGFAADDLSHLLAELMENASSFSPPDLPVVVSGWLLESGEVMLSVQDEGIGMQTDRLDRLNTRLSDFDPESPYDQETEDGLGLGLYVVARLAHRHGVRVQLREQKQGGVAAVVVLPATLLTEAPQPTSMSGTGTFSLPGADAEANSNVLHARTKPTDPLVALAERAVEDATDASGGPAEEAVVVSGSSAGDAGDVSRGSAEGTVDVFGGSAQGAGDVSGGWAGDAGDVSGGSAEDAADVFGGSAEGTADASGGPAEDAVRDAFGDPAEHAVRGAFDGMAEHAVRDAAGDSAEQPVHEQTAPDADDMATRPKAPAETYAESTMELLLPDLATDLTPDLATGPAPDLAMAPGPDLTRDPAPDAPDHARALTRNPAPDRTTDPATGLTGSPAPDVTPGHAPDPAAGFVPDRTTDPATGLTGSPAPDVTPGPAPDPAAGLAADRGPGGTPDPATHLASHRRPDSTPDVTPGHAPDPAVGLAPDRRPDVTSDPGTHLASHRRPDSTPDVTPGPAPDPAVGLAPDRRPDATSDPGTHLASHRRPDSTPDVTPDPAAGLAAHRRPDSTPDGTPGPAARLAVDTRPSAGFTAGRVEVPQARRVSDAAVADGGRAPQGPPAGDDESGTGGAGGSQGAEGEAEAVTAKGLPKRTPRITAPAAPPRQRTTSVDAEALRRRLGGFRSGAQAGYRAVAAEIAERTEDTTGGTVEEASS